MPDTIYLSAFDQGLKALFATLGPDALNRLINKQSDQTLAARVEQLAAKSNEGELSAAERVEYADYVRANKLVAILQQSARRYLKSINAKD